jgi:hypothetical protein
MIPDRRSRLYNGKADRDAKTMTVFTSGHICCGWNSRGTHGSNGGDSQLFADTNPTIGISSSAHLPVIRSLVVPLIDLLCVRAGIKLVQDESLFILLLPYTQLSALFRRSHPAQATRSAARCRTSGLHRKPGPPAMVPQAPL